MLSDDGKLPEDTTKKEEGVNPTVTTTTSALPASEHIPLIQILPPSVVDRIAAGECVQRPCSAVKELLENALDAGSTEVTVSVDAGTGGLGCLEVTDNGHGLAPEDLAVAALRHATSKLRALADFRTLHTFGFRGEALASLSMVAQLSIHSRTRSSPVGYRQSYHQGQPQAPAPAPAARKVGTTVLVQDLFYNLPHRQRMRPAEEYQAILKVVQSYAIHYAHQGIGLICQKCGPSSSSSSRGGDSKKASRGAGRVDFNSTNSAAMAALRRALTSSDPPKETTTSTTLASLQMDATKHVIAQVHGSAILPHLQPLECTNVHQHNKDDTIPEPVPPPEPDLETPTFSCTGWVSNPAYELCKRTVLVLFINHRWVECNDIKRALEEAYCDFTKTKPFVYLSITVPPTQVDVNIHPTKREVALLHADAIRQSLAEALRQSLTQSGWTFSTAAVRVPAPAPGPPLTNPHLPRKPPPPTAEAAPTDPEEETNRSTNLLADHTNVEKNSSQVNNSKSIKRKPLENPAAKPPPSKLIRTHRATPVGALEPFVLVTHTQSSTIHKSQRLSTETSTEPGPSLSQSTTSSSSSLQPTPAIGAATQEPISAWAHLPGCPLAQQQLDLSQPGAFATALAQCTCIGNDKNGKQNGPLLGSTVVQLPRQAFTRPKKVAPTDCSYTSIRQLRRRIEKGASVESTRRLRSAYFVGVVSQHRSLIQCGEDLVLWNHYSGAREMFYQLALTKFGGGASMASLGPKGVDIQTLVGQVVQLEEFITHNADSTLAGLTDRPDLLVSETNQTLAEQAAACLHENSAMLQEYFSIGIGKCEKGQIVLTGLPVLLDGHIPERHGLPLFLLRLATEVNWTEEKPCFHGICRELGSYYSQLPCEERLPHYVRHILFPAVSTLLTPQMSMDADSFVQLTSLSKLYKVFERC